MMEEYIFDWRNILLVFGIVFLIFHNNKSIGIVLLAVWALFYLKDIIDFSREISEFIWPALLIIAGGFLIYNSNTKKNDKQQLTKQDENNNHTPLTQQKQLILKTAILYTTTYGSTEKVANYIAEKLENQEIVLVNMAENKNFDFSEFDNIILGGSIYLGDIQPEMFEFCTNNLDALLQKNIGIFVCGIEPDLIRQDAEIEMSFPKKLYNHAQATAFVGGEINMELLNGSQKFITNTLLGIQDSKSFLQYDLIDIFIYQMELNGE